MKRSADSPVTDPLVKKYQPGESRGTQSQPAPEPMREIGGRKDGTDPTRYGDWEKNGRCIDF